MIHHGEQVRQAMTGLTGEVSLVREFQKVGNLLVTLIVEQIM